MPLRPASPLWNLLLLLGLCAATGLRAGDSHNEGEIAMPQEVRKAIEVAQEYIARSQRSDGAFQGHGGDETYTVATACMALMVNGNLPGEGKYGKEVARSVDYLIKCQRPIGLLTKSDHVAGPMYQHGYSTSCLAEAWGQTRNKDLYEKLKKAVDLIIRCQNDRGGWRYNPKPEDADLSVTVLQLLALRAAKDAGINVPKETIDLAIRYVEGNRSQPEKDGTFGFGYSGAGRGFSTTSMGAMSLMLCGQYKMQQLQGALDLILRCREKKEDRNRYYYCQYYAALAMYQAGSQGGEGKKYWLKWYPDISREIVSLQEKNKESRFFGGFRSPDGGAVGGGLYETNIAVLILGLPFRYLPIYQR